MREKPLLLSEKQELYLKFHRLARESYPGVGEPGTVWVLTEVLGWGWDKVTRTAVDGFGRTGYRVFMLDDDGNSVYDEKTKSMRAVTRKWTNKEKKLLRDWWWLLGL